MKHEVEEMNSAATKPRKGAPSEADQKEMMKKVEAAGTPGPQHKALDALVGNWKAEVKCWMEPGSEAQISKGTAKTAWTLNGRFLEEEFKGDMMGKPFVGRSLMGYDNVKQTFNMVWVADSQTSMFFCEGKGDSGNKVITLEGTTSCAVRGKDIPTRCVFRLQDGNKHIFEMFDGSQGFAKTMEIIYTKQ